MRSEDCVSGLPASRHAASAFTNSTSHEIVAARTASLLGSKRSCISWRRPRTRSEADWTGGVSGKAIMLKRVVLIWKFGKCFVDIRTCPFRHYVGNLHVPQQLAVFHHTASTERLTENPRSNTQDISRGAEIFSWKCGLQVLANPSKRPAKSCLGASCGRILGFRTSGIEMCGLYVDKCENRRIEESFHDFRRTRRRFNNCPEFCRRCYYGAASRYIHGR